MPNQNLACFARHLKIITIFRKVTDLSISNKLKLSEKLQNDTSSVGQLILCKILVLTQKKKKKKKKKRLA